MQKPIITSLKNIIPILSEEHQQLIDSIVHQIESNHVTYILPTQGLSAVQIAETASRTIELAKSGQTYIAKPHLIESFDDFDAKLVEPLKKKLSKSSIVVIETNYNNYLEAVPQTLILADELASTGAKIVIPCTKDELNIIKDIEQAIRALSKPVDENPEK